jgi:astacin (peptidase family M12A)
VTGRDGRRETSDISEVLVCTPRSLPTELWDAAAQTAIEINPVNRAPVEHLSGMVPGFVEMRPAFIAVLTTKYWHNADGVHLTVGFLDDAPADVRKRIVKHMNAWAKTANVKFSQTKTDPQVRIARDGGAQGGYWSYLGTDILHVEPKGPTMNLQAFSMDTPESEFHRVVRHETGHTLGFPHEHMRKELVARIDPDKAIAYFGTTQGWSPEMVKAQVLTPLEDSLLWATAPDPSSIMCYQIPGSLTKDGEPIAGGTDIDDLDYQFAGKLYPKMPKP